MNVHSLGKVMVQRVIFYCLPIKYHYLADLSPCKIMNCFFYIKVFVQIIPLMLQ